MKKAFIIHNNPDVETVINSKQLADIEINFIDEGTLKGKKEARTIKGKFAARLTPFIGILDEDKLIKGFYSEASKDVINDFINWYETIS